MKARGRLLQVLETAGNIGAIVICIALLAPYIQRNINGGFAKITTEPGLRVGATFADLPNVSYPSNSVTVAIFLNSHCFACRQSLPDYGLLRHIVAEANGEVRSVGVFKNESQNAIAEFGLGLPAVQVNDFRTYKVSGTPTIVIIDRQARIRDFWVGKLTLNARNNLLQRIREIENVN